MTPERWQQIDKLFHEALACEPAQRAAFLANACADDELLRLEVESLISSHQDGQSFIETPAGDVAAEMLGTHKPTLEPGHQIDNYKIVRELGAGGMGEVYLADDTRLNRKIALKLLPPQFTIDLGRVRRFDQEARAASALNHPNIVTVYDIGQSNSTHFIATEFVDGLTLREHLANAEMTLGQVLDVAAQVAYALAAAHEAGIVHRDIKPENIMLRGDGFVKVLDFGLAKLSLHNAATPGTQTATKTLETDPGILMGTVHYMSPEQARGDNMDHRTDIWSLGVVLYEMLTGRMPFTGETSSHVIVSILETEPAPVRRYVEGPIELERIVKKCLSKQRDERHQSANGLASELKSLRQELEVEARLKRVTQLDENGRYGRAPHASSASTSEVSAYRTSGKYLAGKFKRHKIFAVTSFIVLLACGIGLSYYLAKLNTTHVTVDFKKSIAVLPLKPLNQGSREEIYEFGIVDSLIHRLSSTKGFVVRPLSATREYAGSEKDPLAAGREQKVDYVLASNYQLADGRIRVTAQLLNVANGQIEDIYKVEKDVTNLLAMQDGIANEIGNKLITRFATTSTGPTAKQGTANEEAYRLYLQAMYLYGKRTERASRNAIELLDQAVRLDPNYALAWAGKAHAHRYASNLGRDTDTHGEYKKSVEAINKALLLDPNLSEAYSALCENKYYYEFDFTGAETECKRAIQLDPNSPLAHEIYGRFLYHRGRFAEGISELKKAIDLEPASLFTQRNLGIALYYAGLYQEAEAQFKRVIAMDENFSSAYSWVRNALEMQGKLSEAFEWFMKAQTILKADEKTIQLYQTLYQRSGYQAVVREYAERFDKSINQYYVVAVLHAYIGNKDKAIEYLNIAYQRREWGINSLLVERRLDSLRDDPRFNELVRRVGLN